MKTAIAPIDIAKIRADFPILHQEVNGRPLVYFDNAASTQKPQVVIDAISEYYSTINSNVHRGVHHLSQLATDAFELSRQKVKTHINAEHLHEVLFTKGTTDSINLLTSTMSQGFVKAGEEIIISALEHHSNIVPWQMLCEKTGAILRVIPMNENGELIMEEYKKLLNEKTRVVAFNHVSNALGTINPAKEMIALAHDVDAVVMIDGAQAVPHMDVDVQDLDADFYAFSAHKLYGPTGIGILYGKEKWLEELPPYQGGGEMIKEVTFEKTTYAGLPHKFEAGTPNIEAGVVLGTAIDYVNEIGLDNIAAYENELLQYGQAKLAEFENMRFIGQAKNKASVISFLLGDIHPYDAGVILDKMGIAVRTGHHCTQPIMKFYNIPGTVRASFSFYNTKEEIDLMVEGLRKVEQMLG
ncbi:cysteine desulfurase-like protein, SufS subfamily [Owenweeksia hongkongensis DSM 17368]|uniref:Probable cysteine desulfurase n=1 Tax=Owenweeksia hongkongensis (strain DSM 17368 / CIP 108786 / JCM 12287 / NRRL B-23963 / UST20020801) TaxID=926562 RepID=G8R907_OWEHD|nr:cysteine desulfurase [Owenweeksia hongkongensis]AEV33615.1 cysteine desulfurase-like protein, SufS subfamily [Owenweeksia hongkongensis DSM 17368]